MIKLLLMLNLRKYIKSLEIELLGGLYSEELVEIRINGRYVIDIYFLI